MPIPDAQGCHQEHEQDQRSAGIADAQRTIGKVRHGGAGGRRGNDDAPVQERMERFGRNLGSDGDHDDSDALAGRC